MALCASTKLPDFGKAMVINMKRYIALLRGINISGKNKISMQELKQHFMELGYEEVLTYLNSGNIIFTMEETSEKILGEQIRAMIQDQFALHIPVFVMLQEELQEILNDAPAWWATGTKEIYDNLIFVMPSVTAEMVAEKIGEPTKELEKVAILKNSIFWSFDRKQYAKANWWKKTASAGIGEMITIRTANTLKKIVTM